MAKQNPSENYLVMLADLLDGIMVCIVVKGKDNLARMLLLLPPDEYSVASISTMGYVKEYDDFIKELQSKPPEGLNFGQDPH